MDATSGNRTRTILLLGLFVLYVVGLTAGGYGYHRQSVRMIHADRCDDLSAVAGLKVGQIVAWRNERLTDARVLTSGIIRAEVLRSLASPGDGMRKADILAHWRVLQSAGCYHDIVLAAPDGRVLLRLQAEARVPAGEVARLVRQAAATRAPVFGDLYRSRDSRRIRLDVAAPILDDTGRPAGVLLLRTNPGDTLYPLLQSWPTLSRSAETLLVRKEGDQALFLNDLRHQAGTALTLRIPLARTDVPAVQALRGRIGMAEGLDYRGVPVISYLRRVPGSAWFMVAKVDRDEIYAEARTRGLVVLLFVVLGIILAGVTTGLVLSQRQRGLYRHLYRSEQERAASERRLRGFLDVTDNIVTQVDTDGRFTYVNRAAAALFETPQEECVGLSAFDFVHPDDRAGTQTAFKQWVADRITTTTFENRQVSRAGRAHHLLWTINPQYEADGALETVWSVAVDVTERRQAERVERQRARRVQAMLDLFQQSDRPAPEIIGSAVDSLVCLTESSHGFLGFIDASETTMSTYLWSSQAARECAVGDGPVEFALAGGGLWAAAASRHQPLIINDYAQPHPLKKGIPEGHVRLTRFLGVPLIRDGRTVLLAGLANKDEEYRTEDQLETTLFLEGLWGILSRKRAEEELRKTLADLARSNQELQQFAYVASHDLQEPLRMVASYTQMLARRYGGKLDADADEFIGYAVDGAKRMQQLINDLLMYSRVESRGREPEPVDCSEVLGQVLTALQVAITESGAVVTSDPLPTVMADEGQIAQLLQNLISNAIKFRRAEDAPRVHLSARREGDEWVFTVKDNGIGIAKDYLERIFIIFQRLHGREAYPGTGIGLAICKRIVERHGGRIWAESEQAKGATFHFTLRRKEGDG